MRRLLLAGLAVVLAAGSGIAVAGSAPGTAVAQCYAAATGAPDARAALPCRLADGVVAQSGAYCRTADKADDTCSTLDGRDISEAEVSAYENSWVHRALTLQRGLDAGAPLFEEQIPHTHNSFNASAYSVPADGSLPSYYPTLTNQDPNQVYSLADQLNMDVRAIELDLHWVPSPYGSAATNGYWVTLCHGDGEQVPGQQAYVHVGCSGDRPAQDGFAEVRAWLLAHPREFLVIYLENQLYPAQPVATSEQAHAVAAALIRQYFGDLAYRPTGVSPGHCATVPYSTSRTQMMARGGRVLLLGNCGPADWSSWVFQRGSAWDESGDPDSYSATDCAHDQQARLHDTTFRREFEDSTFVTAATSAPHPPMSAATVATMVRCGVNIIGMDQLRPQDGRLAALVWSWSPDQPGRGGCATQGADGRFRSAGCDHRLPAACLGLDGSWHVTSRAVRWRDGARACGKEFAGSTFAVPVNGFRNALLQSAKPVADRAVWLDYAQVRGTWTPGALR